MIPCLACFYFVSELYCSYLYPSFLSLALWCSISEHLIEDSHFRFWKKYLYIVNRLSDQLMKKYIDWYNLHGSKRLFVHLNLIFWLDFGTKQCYDILQCTMQCMVHWGNVIPMKAEITKSIWNQITVKCVYTITLLLWIIILTKCKLTFLQVSPFI